VAPDEDSSQLAEELVGFSFIVEVRDGE